MEIYEQIVTDMRRVLGDQHPGTQNAEMRLREIVNQRSRNDEMDY